MVLPAAMHPSIEAAMTAQHELSHCEAVVERVSLWALDAEVVLVGTSHLHPDIAAAAAGVVLQERPHAVMVELDCRRYRSLSREQQFSFGVQGMALPWAVIDMDEQPFCVPPWLSCRDDSPLLQLESKRQSPRDTDSQKPATTHRPAVKVAESSTAARASATGSVSNRSMVLVNGKHPPFGALQGMDLLYPSAAAHAVGALLLLGDRDYRITHGRKRIERRRTASTAAAAVNAATPAEIAAVDFHPPARSFVGWVCCSLQRDWHGAAAHLRSMAAASRAAGYASGSEEARMEAANPLLAENKQELLEAVLQWLVHGEAIASSQDDASPGAVVAAGGRAAATALVERIADATMQLPAESTNAFFLEAEAEAARVQAAALLTLEGNACLASTRSHGSAIPTVTVSERQRGQLARLRRAAAGTLPGSGWGPGTAQAIGPERDAILASSILHMRDAIEQTAAERKARQLAACSIITGAGEASGSILAVPTAAGAASAASLQGMHSPVRFVAVVGAGHVPGILRYLRAADTLAAQAAEHLDALHALQSPARTEAGTASARAGDTVGVNDTDLRLTVPGSADEHVSDLGIEHAELVRQGFLPAQPLPLLPLNDPLPGQLVGAAASQFSGALIEKRLQLQLQPNMADLAAAPVTAQSSSEAAVLAPQLPRSEARKTLLRAVAACSVDEQIAPTLRLPKGSGGSLLWKPNWKDPLPPAVALAAGCNLVTMSSGPRRLRMAAGVFLLAAGGLTTAVVSSVRACRQRIESGYRAADAAVAARGGHVDTTF